MIPALGGIGSFPPLPHSFQLNPDKTLEEWQASSFIMVHNPGQGGGGTASFAILRPRAETSFSPEFSLTTSSTRASGHAAGGCRVNDLDGRRPSPAKEGTLNVIAHYCLESEVYFTVVDLFIVPDVLDRV